jgi:hypothetical protein
MALKAIVENLDDVPEGSRGEYTEVTDPKTKAVQYVLQIEGSIETHPAAKVLKDELARRRISERAATEKLAKLAPFEALGDPTEVLAKLDRIPELEAAAEGKIDETKMAALVDGRVKAKVAPLERENSQLKEQVKTLGGEVEGYKTKEKHRTVGDAVRAAIGKSQGFQSVALEDALLFAERHLELNDDGNVVTKDNVGVTPGVDAVVWLSEMQPRKPHWWGTTQGGGATGGGKGNTGGGANPFSHAGWNVTAQGQLVRENRQRADQMAKAAGTTVGGPRPAAPAK